MNTAPALCAPALLLAAFSGCRTVAESPERPPLGTSTTAPTSVGARAPGAGGGPALADVLAHAMPTTPDEGNNEGNIITRVERVAHAAALAGRPAVEIEVASVRAFPVLGELATLRIGPRVFTLSRYPRAGDLRALVFTLTLDEWDALPDRAEVAVVYGTDTPAPPGRTWTFGALRKAAAR